MTNIPAGQSTEKELADWCNVRIEICIDVYALHAKSIRLMAERRKLPQKDLGEPVMDELCEVFLFSSFR